MTGQTEPTSLSIRALSSAYASGALTPTKLADRLIDADDRQRQSQVGVWIYRVDKGALRRAAEDLEARKRANVRLPLYGIPFAVKDNFDVAGLPTTAACPDFSYVAQRTAPAVARLLEAGAMLVGKTNLDQFATGLVGVRSPYGIPLNPFDSRYITGGSSSGSAAAVARDLVAFSLGTDTAGSGRVPAGCTNLVGIKPSAGLVSTTGVVPACRSLDCVSVFAKDCSDARAAIEIMTGYDAEDPRSRTEANRYAWQVPAEENFVFGVPAQKDLEFFGDNEAANAFEGARETLKRLGGTEQIVPLDSFFEVARLLYDGPWVAERLSGLADFVRTHASSLLPATRKILEGGERISGTEAFAGMHRLRALSRTIEPLWSQVRFLLVPTTPTIYRIDEIEADPIRLNARLGLYTNFVNLLDLAAVAVPNGFRIDGLPTGITLIGPWGSDARLLAQAERFSGNDAPTTGAFASSEVGSNEMLLAVVGAHLSGQPLNRQLTDLGASLQRACRTAPVYRFFALPGTTPPKPGLVRVREQGVPIDVEVWRMHRDRFGDFFRNVAAPLSIGTIELEDGDRVAGFLCESTAVEGARDISHFGGWRQFKAAAAT